MGVALIKAPQETAGKNGSRERSRSALGTRRSPHRAPVSEASLDAPIVTVFQTPDGQFHHGWCHQPLEFHGRRAALEVDFYCLRCVEHVTLPESVLPRIPVRARIAEA
jgi:hypothetical protein